MNRLDKANKFINENKHLTNSKPLYHFAPPYGWINDPNGFCYHDGEYHLFYQAYPYDVIWSDMHWGHAVSKDLHNWEYKGIVMANDTLADANGAFSGSAIEKNGELYFMYTGHIDPNLMHERVDKEVIQHQNLAKYNAEGTITKYENNPVISHKDLPKGYYVCDFRDPKVYIKDGIYYAVLCVRNEENRGSLILYNSQNLIDWNFVSDIYRSNPSDNILYECPDLFTIDGKDVLVFSVMPAEDKYEGEVIHCVKYAIGKMDYESGKFIEESIGYLDSGRSFYAPQTNLDKDGNRVIIAWLCERANETMEFMKKYNYNGIMSMVRKLQIIDNKLISKPTNVIESYQRNKIEFSNVLIDRKKSLEKISGNKIRLNIELEKLENSLTISLFSNGNKSYNFNIDNNRITYNSMYKDKNTNTVNIKNIKTLDFYIDTHVIELYINEGEYVISEICYDDSKSDGIVFNSEGAVLKELAMYEII